MARQHQKHSWLLRLQIGREYVEGSRTLKELSAQYGIPGQTIWDWADSYKAERPKASNFNVMTTEEQKQYEALKQENEALKKQLELAQMKGIAMQTVIDLARKELGIDLIKNYGAKQSAKSKKTTRGQK